MVAKYLSVAAGSILLIGCLVGLNLFILQKEISTSDMETESYGSLSTTSETWVNEAVNPGDNNFKNDLSKLYFSLASLESNPESVDKVRKPYGRSIEAFTFISYGVFLLDEIHNLMGKAHMEGSRKFSKSTLENYDLDALFISDSFDNLKNENNTDIETLRNIVWESRNATSVEHLNTDAAASSHINNIFRAMMNLMNAYTKDSQALECIWAIYCENLDETSSTSGLYGIAARLNSIGLRLIMHQISTELTMEVLMNSLFGWDRLPCNDMFPQCGAERYSH